MADTSGTQSSESLHEVALEGQQSSEGMPSRNEPSASSGSEPQTTDNEGSTGPDARGQKPDEHGGGTEIESSSSACEAGESVQSAEPNESGEAVEPSSEAAPPAEGEAAGAEGAGEKSSKRRKRRKKHKPEAEGALEEGGEASGGKPKHKDGSAAPFSRFMAGVSSRRHAFAVNEEVAGRVIRCDRGAIIIDLFGKATAIADENEPREIPPPLVREEPKGATEEGAAGVGPDGQPIEAAPPAASQETELAQPQAAESAPEAQTAESAPVVAAPESDAGADHYQAHDEPHDELHEDAEDEGASVENRAPEQLPVLTPIEVGKVFKGRIGAIAESGHVALINRHIDVKKALVDIDQYRQERKRVQGVVFGFNRGGFDVIVEGVRAFCPASGMSFEEIEDPRAFVGQKLDFTLPPVKGGSKDLVVTRRSILEKERRKKVKELIRSLKPGQKIHGRVTQVRDYGLFVDIGGFEGLVHQTELSYAFGVKPAEVAKAGDEVDVKIVDVVTDGESGKRERNTRVSLSIKALLEDPWDLHPDAVAEGTIRAGKITRTTDFGAFVELAPSVEGLLRIGELGREISHANQAVKEGEEVYVVIERVDRHARRISLSKLSDSAVQDFKEGKLGDPTLKQPSLHTGARVMVKVESIEHRGLAVRVIGAAGKRSRAFVPSNETGTERGTDLRKAFPRNTEFEVKILGVERDGSLKCSKKALAIDDERRAIKEYRREAASQGLGTFGDLLRAKLGGSGNPTRQ
jgi:small subunit ribosomal protein S1